MAFSQTGLRYDGRNEIVDPAIKRALDHLASQIAAGLKQVNATPGGATPAPPQISSITVVGANGIFKAQIQDNNPVNRGIEYFLEYSANPGGPWTVVSLGPSRDWSAHLGNVSLYFQAYSQYATSDPSPPLQFGGASNPTAVPGGGAIVPPATPQMSAGSGTAPSNGLSGGSGYGKTPFRGSKSLL